MLSKVAKIIKVRLKRAQRNFDKFYRFFIAPFSPPLIAICAVIIAFDFENDCPNWACGNDYADIIVPQLPSTFFVILVFTIVLYSFFSFFYWSTCKPTIKKLEECIENKKADIAYRNDIISEQKDGIAKTQKNAQAVINGYLEVIGKKLNFGSRSKNYERVSLYIRDIRKGKNCFILFGRYSPNPKFNKFRRDVYDDGQGCISEGWEHDWHFDNEFDENEKKWNKRNCDIYHIPFDTSNQIQMKSRLYGVKKIESAEVESVLLVEAIENDRFEEHELKAVLDAESFYIAKMISTLYDYIKPNLNDGERE